MITVETLNSELPDVEMIYVACEEHVGASPCRTVDIQRSDLDANQQAVYDNFVGLFVATNLNEVSNAPCMLSINRGTSLAIADGTTQQDYTVDFDATQQGYVEAFVQLIMDLYE
jgi:hypothetical protein